MLTAFVLPVFIVVILPLAIIGMVFYVGHRRNKMAHETLRAMIEKGVPITPEMVAQLGSRHIVGAPRQSGQSRRLLPGLVLIGVGAALLITGHGHLGAGGLILLFVGVAFLIVWLVERKNKNDAQPPQS